MEIIFAFVLLHLICAVLAFINLRKKGYTILAGILIGGILGFWGFILSLFLRKRDEAPHEQSKSSPGSPPKNPVEQKSRTVSITVNKHPGIRKPVEKIIGEILSDAGIIIEHIADSTLTIEIKANSQSGVYGIKGSDIGSTYYTGAEVNGKISFHDPGTNRHLAKTFYGVRKLPDSVRMSDFYKNPSAAPIDEAFSDSGFFPILIRMLRGLYGSRILAAALGSEHYHISWLAEYKDHDAISAYIQASVSNGWRAKENATRLLDKISPKWRADLIPVQSRKLISGSYAERRLAASVLSNAGWKPADENEKLSYWLASSNWAELEMAGFLASQFLFSALKVFNPYTSEKEEIETFANIIKTLIKIHMESPESFTAMKNASATDLPFGNLVLLSILKDRTASDLLNTLLMNAAQGDRSKLFSILEQVDWEPENEAGVWYWIEKKEWEKAAGFGKTAARPLMEFISNEGQDQYEKIKAAGAISLTGEKTIIPELIARAKSSKWDISKALTAAATALDPDNIELRMYYYLSQGSSSECAKLGQKIVESLIPEIHDQKWSVHAIRALGEVGGPRAAEALIACLENGKGVDTHGEIVSALGSAGEKAAARYLIPRFKLAEFHERARAAKALASIKDPDTVGDILALLTDEDENIQMNAVLALGWKGNHQAVKPLMEILQSNSTKLSKKVIEALILIGDPSLEKFFTGQLSDPDPEIQFKSASALIELGWNPGKESAPAVFWAAKGDYKKCREFGSQAVPAIIEAWKQAEKDQSYSSTYLYAAHKEALTELDQILVDMKPDSVPQLIEVFKAHKNLRFPLMRVFYALNESAAEPLLCLSALTKDEDIRSVAGKILYYADHSIISALHRLTSHSEKIVRQSSMKVLGWHPDPSSVEPILRNLFQEEDYVLRGVGVETLGIIGGDAAVKGLIRALADPSEHVRIVAAKALSRIGHPASTEALIETAQKGDFELQILAITGLGKIGNAQAKQALEMLISEDNDFILKNEIDAALKNIHPGL